MPKISSKNAMIPTYSSNYEQCTISYCRAKNVCRLYAFCDRLPWPVYDALGLAATIRRAGALPLPNRSRHTIASNMYAPPIIFPHKLINARKMGAAVRSNRSKASKNRNENSPSDDTTCTLDRTPAMHSTASMYSQCLAFVQFSSLR